MMRYFLEEKLLSRSGYYHCTNLQYNLYQIKFSSLHFEGFFHK